MRVGVLEHAVEVLEPVTQLPGGFRFEKVVEDRLVVLIDQHHHPLTTVPMRLLDQLAKTACDGAVLQRDAQRLGFGPQQFGDMQIKRFTAVQHAIGEAQTNHRMLHLPVPLVVDIEPLEQRLAALEQAAQGVEQQALAEAPRPGEEVVAALFHQPMEHWRLVDIVVATLAQLVEGLNTDGQFLASALRHDLS